MKALLLSAGEGTRLRPLTLTVPKCLVPINGVPLLDYWLHLLDDSGIEGMLINLHYLAPVVRKFLETTGVRGGIDTVYEDRLLGTGGTLLKNRSFFGNEPVMMIHTDNLSLFDCRAFIAAHIGRPAGADITMMTFSSPTPETCGIVALDERGVVNGFYEKVQNPPGNLANAAVYIVEPSVLDFLESLHKEVIDFSTEVLPRYIGRMSTYHNDIYHRDIGNPQSLDAAQREFPSALARFTLTPSTAKTGQRIRRLVERAPRI